MGSEEFLSAEVNDIDFHLHRFFHGSNNCFGITGEAFVELDFSDQPPQDFPVEEMSWRSLESFDEQKRKREDYHKDAPKGKKPKYWALFTNFQGFPADLCEYSEELEDLVFDPPGYTMATKLALCKSCLLRPCIVKGKGVALNNYCIESTSNNEGNYLQMMWDAKSKTLDLLKEIFGPTYMRANPNVPTCATEFINKHIKELREMEDVS
jgi:hypothetical protein